MSTKKSNLKKKKLINDLVKGFTLLGCGLTIGYLYRQSEINSLKRLYKELLRESDKKTYYLGKQFAEYIKKTRT